MLWTPSITAIAAAIAIMGVGIDTPLQISNASLLSGGRISTIQPCTRDNLILQVKKFGTPTNDCTIVVDFFSDDAATNVSFGVVLTNADITYADADVTGKVFRIPTMGKFYRVRLLLGTMTGANGFNIWARG